MKPKPPVHLEIQTHRANPVGVLRSSYRETGSIKHQNHGRITGLSLDQLKLIQAAFRGEVIPRDSPQAFQTLASKEYGASYALLQLAKDLELEQAIYSRSEPWVRDCLSMIVGRVVSAGSKLALSNQAKNTALWELCGVQGWVDVEDHCYGPMDRLLARQKAIQQNLARKHLQQGHLVLYDITSTYFEGAYAQSEIVLFGYNRDGKKGHEQVVLGLLCNAQGCPVGVEVFAGNTQDAATVVGKIQELRRDYGLEAVTFVGDRGMARFLTGRINAGSSTGNSKPQHTALALSMQVFAPPTIWFCLEKIASYSAIGRFWVDLAMFQSTMAPLIWVIGARGITFLIVLFNSIFAACIYQRSTAVVMWGALIAIIAGGCIAYSSFASVKGSTLKVALLQGNFPQTWEWRREEADRSIIDTYLAMSKV